MIFSPAAISMTDIPFIFQTAAQHHQAGRLVEAEALYRQIIDYDPSHALANYNLALIALRSGKEAVAVELLGKVITIRPNFTEAHFNLGKALTAIGDMSGAAASCRQAISLRPNYAEAYDHLGYVLFRLGECDQAVTMLRQALQIQPDLIQALHNLGQVLAALRQFDEATAVYQQAVSLRPALPELHNNLGCMLKGQGRTGDAITAYLKALDLRPDYADALSNLGEALSDAGRFDDAIVACRRAVLLEPSHAQAQNNLGVAFENKGELEPAVSAFQRAVQLQPKFSLAWNNLANALCRAKQYESALAGSQHALKIDPQYAQAHNTLGVTLQAMGRMDEAIAAFYQALSIRADDTNALCNLANALRDRGDIKSAIANYHRALSLQPDLADVHSNLIFAMQYDPSCDLTALAAEAGRWNARHAEPFRALTEQHANDRRSDRRLRIGYVSPDFRDHVVGRNILPLFRNHDRAKFEIYCYAQVPSPDAITSEFKLHTDAWRSLVGVPDKEAASQIREDRIDILVDLSLHTANNRLLVFARKPAPIQASFAGYPGSTGLWSIDYRISDPYLETRGFESGEVGRALRLHDSFWCYDPPGNYDLPVNELPAIDNGFVTFGCLNNFCKINEPTLTLWAKVMSAVPNSRLFLLANQGSQRDLAVEKLARCGISGDRISFVSRLSHRNYLSQYHRIDIGLDTFPYNGHTTSLDSFWMAVPVVSLVGPSPVSRAGLSQLSNLNLKYLAADTAEQFVQIAASLADDLPRLARLRSTLRSRMEQSPLMNAKKFAENIESAYRQIWQSWCGSAVP